MAPLVLAANLVMLSAVLAALGDVQRPTQGYQIGKGPGSSIDIIFPLTIVQCEPVIIYYNMTNSNYATLYSPDSALIVKLWFPAGIGYLDWICDIPKGYSFQVGYVGYQYYTVQPGSSSACLGDITTTYEYASYSTSNFHFYTQHSSNGNSFYSTVDQQPTIDFPTSPFPTITVNPNLAVTSSAVFSTTSSPASPHKSKKAVIAGGIIGGTAFVLLTLTLLFIFLWKRAKLRSNAATKALVIESEPEAYSRLMTSRPGLAYTSTPVLPSSGQEGHFSHIDSTHTVRREIEFTPNIAEAAVTTIHHIPFATLPGNISSSAPIMPPAPPKTENTILLYHSLEQSSNEPRNPAPIVAWNASADLAVPEAPAPLISVPVPESSASIAPPVPSKPENIVVSYHLPEHSTSESSRNPGTGLASVLDAVRGLTASEWQALVASLDASTDPAPPEASSQPAPPGLSTSVATQEELPDIANILGVISRAQLSTRERHAMVASLNTLLTPDRAMPGGLTRGNTVSSPPPYAD